MGNLAPRSSVGAMGAHLDFLSGTGGWRVRNERAFAEHEGLRFFILHPLDHLDRDAMVLHPNTLKADVGGFLARSGLDEILRPESARSLQDSLDGKTGFAFYRPLKSDLRPGVVLGADEPPPQNLGDMRVFMEYVERRHNRPPVLAGVINSYQPLMTRQEIVGSFGYGDRREASDTAYLQPFQLSDFHQFVDAHERFHGSFSLKLEHAYHKGYFRGEAAEMIQNAQEEKSHRADGEWSTPYGKYIEENVVDAGALLLHLKEGGDPSFVRFVGDLRASRVRESGDFDHDSAETLYALAEKAEDKSFIAGLQHLDTHELTDVAVRITAENVRPRLDHYGMMKYAALGRTFSDSKCAELLQEVEDYTNDWEFRALPTKEAKDRWHGHIERGELAQDRLADSDEKFARCQTFFPEMADMDEPQQEAFMIEVEERALMAFVTKEYPHLDNPADRKMLLEHRLSQVAALKPRDEDEKDFFDTQKDVIDVMCYEEELLQELEGLRQEDATYGTREGEEHFFQLKLRAAAACARIGEPPVVEPVVIEGLMERRLAGYAEQEQAPTQMREGLGR